MLKCSFHTHSRFDDGKGELEDYVHSALEKDFKVLGFSAHAPVPLDTCWHMKRESLDEYIRLAKSLRTGYADRIEIYTGLEADYFRGCTNWRKYEGIDYTIGAVHFVLDSASGRCFYFDGDKNEFEENLKTVFGGDIRRMVSGYYGLVREMLRNITPDIVAHLDVIKKNNAGCRYFDENEGWYREEVLKTLETIARSGAVLEVNTGGIARGYTKEPYPGGWILGHCFDMNIPVMINSDAHLPDSIDCCYKEVRKILRDAGYRRQRILLHGEWQDAEL